MTEPLSTRQLEILVSLADQGSFTKAAVALGLSQSTVSEHLADLERRTGLRLVDRARGHVHPTAAGRTLLRHAREAVRAETRVRQVAAGLTGLLEGSLIVGASTIPAVYLVPGYLAQLRCTHPNIAIQLRTGDSREMLDRVAAGAVDLSVVGATPRRGRGLHSDQVGHDELVLICPPTHPFASRHRVSVRSVLAEPMVVRPAGSGTHAATLEGLRRAAPGAEPIVALEVGSTEAAKAAVSAGLGVSFVSSLATHNELATDALATVAVQGFAVRRAFHLVTREEPLLSPATQAFRALVVGTGTEPSSATTTRRRSKRRK